MQSMNINKLLQKTEGKILEFKQDLSSPEKVLRTIIAFANTSGGALIIGVEDSTKKILGISEPYLFEHRFPQDLNRQSF